jgi:hypothetical protein
MFDTPLRVLIMNRTISFKVLRISRIKYCKRKRNILTGFCNSKILVSLKLLYYKSTECIGIRYTYSIIIRKHKLF